MVQKIFTDDSSQLELKLSVFMNTQNRCAIVIEGQEDHEYGIVTINEDELTELINELKLIRKQICSTL